MTRFLRLIPGWSYAESAWALASSKLGVCVIALCLGWFGGSSNADRKADVANLRSQIAALQADLRIHRSQEWFATKQASTLHTHLKINKEKVDALQADRALSAVPRFCILDDAGARRLRDIR